MLEEDKDILKNKKSFVLFCDKRKTVESMTDEDAGKLFKAIYQYQDEGKHELTGLLNTVFETFIPAFNANDEKYIATAKRNRMNGAKGGRPKKEENPNKPNETQKNPMGFLETQTNPKNLDTDTDTDTDIKNKNILYIEEKQKKLLNSSNPDLMFDKNIEKVFNLYKELCPNLIPIKFEKRDKDRRQQIKDLLELCENDFEYIKELFVKANEQIIFYDEKISFKSLIKNHEAIYQGKGNKINTQQQNKKDEDKGELLPKYDYYGR